jgi:hypothetical protein
LGADLDTDIFAERALVVVPPVNLSAERQSVGENQRMLLPRLGAAVNKLRTLRAQASEQRGRASALKVTVEGSSDAAASADLQSQIEESDTSIDATVSSTTGIPAEVRGSFHRIGLRETLVRLFVKLDAATASFVFDNLHIHGGLRVDRRRVAPTAPGPATPALNAGPAPYGFHTNENPAVAKP